jgi:hypothetical protein
VATVALLRPRGCRRLRDRASDDRSGRHADVWPQRPPDACSRRRPRVSVEPSPPRQCPAVARAAAHVALAAMRAITHVEGKAIGSSRRARRGRRLRVEDDHGAFGGTPISSSPNCVAEDVGGPSSCDRARMPGWTSRWGRGRLGPVQDDQETFDRGCRFCARFARGCGRPHTPGRRARLSSIPSVSRASTGTPPSRRKRRPASGAPALMAPLRCMMESGGRGRAAEYRRRDEVCLGQGARVAGVSS